MGGSPDQLSLHHTSRRAPRAAFAVMVSFALLAVTLFTPAMATSGGDLESVRATVAETYAYKIDLLTALKDETSNDDRKAVYQGGIDELANLAETRVATEDSIDELWALKDRAHTIYGETVAAADQVGQTPAEKLAKAKRAANETIEYKIALLKQWIEGYDDPDAQRIVADGIATLRGLFAKVEAATTPDVAYALKDQAYSIYHQTIDAAENAKEGSDKPEEKTPAEKAAEALEGVRRETLRLIERKTAILQSAAAAASIPAVVTIYEKAAGELDALTSEARSAKTAGSLKDIRTTAAKIFEGAKEDATAVRDTEDNDPNNTLDAYLDGIASYVTRTLEAAVPTANASPGTFDDLAAAKVAVVDAVAGVREVTESGNRLGDRWDALNKSLSSFRLALIRHYISLGEPVNIAGFYIPG